MKLQFEWFALETWAIDTFSWERLEERVTGESEGCWVVFIP